MSIKEAVQRLRQGDYFPDVEQSSDIISSWAHLQDLVTVKEAYIAEHPVDMDEPITEEWLETRLDGTMFEGAFVIRPFVLSLNGDAWTLYCLHGQWVPVTKLQTCGQVRLLCRTFNVELKEPA